MKSRRSFEQLRRDLLGRGLSLTYVERVIAELDDHRQDLLAEKFGKEADRMQANRMAETRLGAQADLAEDFVLKYRSRTFAGRHPVWSFVVAPIPLTLLVWIAFYLTAFTTFWGVSLIVGKQPVLEGYALQALHWTSQIVPAVIAAMFLARLLRRSGRPAAWFLPAAGMVALVAACHQSKLKMPTTPGTGQFMVGFGSDIQAMQLGLAVAVGAILYWRLVRHPDPVRPAPSQSFRQAA